MKYSDEAGIVISKTSNMLQHSGKIMDTGTDVWKKTPLERGSEIDEFINRHSTGGGLGSNFPVADRLDNGVLVSTKSLDV